MVVETASLNFLEYQWSGAKVEVDKRDGFYYTFLWSYMFRFGLYSIIYHTTLYVVPWRGPAPEPVYQPPEGQDACLPVFPVLAPRSNHKCQLLSLLASFLSCLPFVILAFCNCFSFTETPFSSFLNLPGLFYDHSHYTFNNFLCFKTLKHTYFMYHTQFQYLWHLTTWQYTLNIFKEKQTRNDKTGQNLDSSLTKDTWNPWEKWEDHFKE